MASHPNLARTLTKGEQKKSIKGVQKTKKSAVKNTLENPFVLNWPVISSEHEGEIRSLLQKSCSGLKKLTWKAPWKEVVKLKGADRKAFLKEYQKKFFENLSPSDVEQNKEREDSLSHLLFGYNAVMRALEKGCIIGVLVKKNVNPSIVVKAFLPVCANKCIPLVPLYDLDALLKSEETLALPHACMVLGLKPSVKDETNRFYSLFTKMCEAVHLATEEDSDEDFVEHFSVKDNKENKMLTTCSQLTFEQIQSYHLTRTHKGKRAFIPGERKEKNVDVMGFGSDFIGFEPTEKEVSLYTEKQQLDRKPKLFNKNVKNAAEEKESCGTVDAMESGTLFFIDVENNDQVCLEGEENLKHESSGLTIVNADGMGKCLEGEKNLKRKSSGLAVANADGMGKCSEKKKGKLKKSKSVTYISAKAKRVKSNPNRKKS